jgi:amino acid transporter
MSLLELFFLVIAGILLIIAAVFAVLGAVEITRVRDYKSDSNLDRAHKWLTWASVVGWIGVFIILLLIILYIYYSAGSTSSGESYSYSFEVRFFLFLTWGTLIACGSLAALGAVDIQNSSKVVEARQKGAQKSAIIATVLALAGGGLIFIAFFVALFRNPSGKKEESSENRTTIVPPTTSSGVTEEAGEAVAENPELLALA